MRMHIFLPVAILSATSLVATSFARADEYSFGGYQERQKGKGDHRPPACVVEAPSGAESAFSIQWSCTDNSTPTDEIRSELWIYRSGNDVAARQIENYLGFPAAGYIDATQLHAASVSEGLPARFRVLAQDKAGNVTMSPYITVGKRGNSLSTCDLEIVTEATEANGGSTGEPSKSVSVNNGVVVATQLTSSTLQIATPEEVEADTCEIDKVCSGSNVRFTIAVNVADDGSATATFSVPDATTTALTGTATLDGAIINRIDLTGDATIEGAKATVTVSCVD